MRGTWIFWTGSLFLWDSGYSFVALVLLSAAGCRAFDFRRGNKHPVLLAVGERCLRSMYISSSITSRSIYTRYIPVVRWHLHHQQRRPNRPSIHPKFISIAIAPPSKNPQRKVSSPPTQPRAPSAPRPGSQTGPPRLSSPNYKTWRLTTPQSQPHTHPRWPPPADVTLPPHPDHHPPVIPTTATRTLKPSRWKTQQGSSLCNVPQERESSASPGFLGPRNICLRGSGEIRHRLRHPFGGFAPWHYGLLLIHMYR